MLFGVFNVDYIHGRAQDLRFQLENFNFKVIQLIIITKDDKIRVQISIIELITELKLIYGQRFPLRPFREFNFL